MQECATNFISLTNTPVGIPSLVVMRCFRQIFALLGIILEILVVSNHTAASDVKQVDLSCQRCNVVFLIFDFFRADYIGLTSDSQLTPNLDRFFSLSIIFKNAYSTSGSSYRSNPSILSSSNPNIYDLDVASYEFFRSSKQLGRWENIYQSHDTISEALKTAGYNTSSWNKGRRSGKALFLDRGYINYRQYGIRILLEDIEKDFRNHLDDLPPPYFASLHAVPTRLHRAFYPVNRPRLEHPNIIYKSYNVDGKRYGYRVFRHMGVSHADQRQAEHQIYQQQLVYADDILANLFRFLESRIDDTLFVLYSGHGTQIGDRQIYASNGTSYESNIRVPLLIRHPNVDSRIVIEEPISLIDLVPTVYDMLELEANSPTEGVSLIPLITGEKWTSRPIYGRNDPDAFVIEGHWKLIARDFTQRQLFNMAEDPEMEQDMYDQNKGIARLLEFEPNSSNIKNVQGFQSWKLTVTPHYEYELYNLLADPAEVHNLADSNPEVVRHLRVLLEDYEGTADSFTESIR